MGQQSAAQPTSAKHRPDVQILEVEPGTANESGETEEVEGEPGRLRVRVPDDRMSGGVSTEESRPDVRLSRDHLVREPLVLGQLRDERENERCVAFLCGRDVERQLGTVLRHQESLRAPPCHRTS